MPAKRTVKFEVEQGEVHVNSIQVEQLSSTAFYCHIDCREKRLDFPDFCETVEQRELTVYLYKHRTEEQWADDSYSDLIKGTQVKITNLPSWFKQAHIATKRRKYGADVFIIKREEDLKKFEVSYWDDSQK